MAKLKTYPLTLFKRNGASKSWSNVIEEYDLDIGKEGVHCIVLATFGPGGGHETERYPWGWIDHIATEHRPHEGSTKLTRGGRR